MGVLDPVTRRRIAALLLILGTILIVAAATDVGPFSDPPTPEEKAENAASDFFAAASDGDFKEFCGLLTKEARSTIEARAAALSSEENLNGCEEILGALVKKQFAGSEAEVISVNVSGPQARAEVKLKLKGEKGTEQRTLLLAEEDGEWLISNPGFG
jgi:hypothetical protein